MELTGVILYGPPAAGKDTITDCLALLDNRYSLYRRLKVGSGRTENYQLATHKALARLRDTGDLLYENEQYGSTYGISRTQLMQLAANRFPVLHLGQPAGVDAVASAGVGITWLVVELWCPRPLATARIEARATGDAERRMHVYDQTERLANAHLRIDTGDTHPGVAAKQVDQAHRSLISVDST